MVSLAALVLSGCTGDVTTTGETLRILGAALPDATLGQAYDQPVQAVGGLRPYDFSLADGQLPPGIELQGGTLYGIPTKIGTYKFTLQVSDANLSKTLQKYTLTVAELPPPKLLLHVPDTQVDHSVTLRAEVIDANQLQGLRSQFRWDPKHFRLVPDSVKSARQGLALLQSSSPGELQVAVVPLGTTLSGATTLFQFDLEPTAGAGYLKVDLSTETVSAGGHHYATSSEGHAPPAAAPTGSTSGSGTSTTTPSGGSTP